MPVECLLNGHQLIVMHLNSKLLFEKYAVRHFKETQSILEIGPTGYPSYYSELVNIPSLKWHTLDIGEEYIGKGHVNPLHIVSKEDYSYPIEDNTFDIVLSGQVMEHIKNIWLWVDELKRITKENGLIIIISPISWSYHEAPVDCWRIYPEGMKALMEEKGLSIIECCFESLEKDFFSSRVKTRPGNSILSLEGESPFSWKLIELSHSIPLLNKFCRRIPVSFDNICVCRK